MTELHTCPCCGYKVFPDRPGSYDICPICFWEDDMVQLAFPDLSGGANKVSLISGQASFILYGVSEERFSRNVRRPKDTDIRDILWRPINVESDRLLSWGNSEDHQKWDSVKGEDLGSRIYYWSSEYWLNKNAPLIRRSS